MDVARSLVGRLALLPSAVKSAVPEFQAALLQRAKPINGALHKRLNALKSAATPGLARSLHGAVLPYNEPHRALSMGFGTVASMADRARYVHLATSMHHVYSTLERELDRSKSPAVISFWDDDTIGKPLRRTASLEADLKELGAWPPAEPSMEAYCYVGVIADAASADEASGSARLLGHVYCRHVMDFVGGQYGFIGPVHRRALGLREGAPSRFDFATDAGSTTTPGAEQGGLWISRFIGAAEDHAAPMEEQESRTTVHSDDVSKPTLSLQLLCDALNEAGELAGSDEAREAIVLEAGRAQRSNLYVHEEKAVGGFMFQHFPAGLFRIIRGYREPKVKQIKQTDAAPAAAVGPGKVNRTAARSEGRKFMMAEGGVGVKWME